MQLLTMFNFESETEINHSKNLIFQQVLVSSCWPKTVHWTVLTFTFAQLVRIAVIIGITRDKDIQPTTASYKPNYKMHEVGNFCLNLFFSLSSYRRQKGYKVKIEAPKCSMNIRNLLLLLNKLVPLDKAILFCPFVSTLFLW